MRILCDVVVQSDVQPSVVVKHNKATLALTWHPPNKAGSELFLIIFSNQNKGTGERFRVKGNLEKVFDRFAGEGKVTLSLKEPRKSLLVKTNDPLQLKSFMSTLKLALQCDKGDRNKIGLSSAAVTAIPQKSQPVTKMIILHRGDFPINGLPRTLKQLVINSIGRCRVDMQITYLKHLTVLNLSDNSITKIPKPVGDMRLVELDLSQNDLGNEREGCDWKWLRGVTLQQTLKKLNLSRNKLRRFPFELAGHSGLEQMLLDGNSISKLPFAIRKMHKLKYFSISSNKLESLPTSLEILRLDTLDISGNLFTMSQRARPPMKFENPIPSLFEIAARVIELKRLPYSNTTLPWDVMDILAYTPLCRCGQICFNATVYESISRFHFNCSHLTTSGVAIVYADGVFCSNKCYLKRHS